MPFGAADQIPEALLRVLENMIAPFTPGAALSADPSAVAVTAANMIATSCSSVRELFTAESRGLGFAATNAL